MTHTLYAYALRTGSHLDADAFLKTAEDFIDCRSWLCPEVWLVKQGSDESLELGINLTLPEAGAEPSGWFDDVEAIATFCSTSRDRFQCDFVIGVADGKQGEDIVEIDSDDARVDYLRRFLG